MIIVNPKAVYPGELRQFESNAEALSAGLTVGTLYHNALGQVFVVMEANP